MKKDGMGERMIATILMLLVASVLPILSWIQRDTTTTVAWVFIGGGEAIILFLTSIPLCFPRLYDKFK